MRTDIPTAQQELPDQLERVEATGQPLEIVDQAGRPKGVLLPPSSFKRLVEVARRTADRDEVEAVLAGAADVAAGRVRPAKDVFRDLFERFGIDEP